MTLNMDVHQMHRMQTEGVKCSIGVGALNVSVHTQQTKINYRNRQILCKSLGDWLKI